MAMVAEREMPARQWTMTWQLDSLALSGGRGHRGRVRAQGARPDRQQSQLHLRPKHWSSQCFSLSLGTLLEETPPPPQPHQEGATPHR